MIVKNGADTLERCLASVRGLVDTMVIGDTGSTDETVSIARAFGAQVLEVPWRNDFAHARNTVLDHLQTDWVLTLDADEELDPPALDWIRQAIQVENVDAYLVQVLNYLSPHLPSQVDQVMLPPEQRGHPQAPDAVAYFVSACCRLFRRRPGLRYTGCVHEMVDYQLYAERAPVHPAGFFIRHFGWYLADAARTARKRALYCDLLAKKLEDMPDDPNTMVRYATFVAEDRGDPEQALIYTRRAAEIDPLAPGAFLFTGMFLRRMGRNEEALAALARVPEWDQPVLRFHLRGDALLGLGRMAESAQAYAEALRLAPLDRLVAGKLGLLEVNTGRVEQGLARLREAAKDHPPIPDVENLLVSALLVAGDHAAARDEALGFARFHARPEFWQCMARCFAQAGAWATARELLELGVAQFPDAHELYSFLVNACVSLDDLAAATAAAERVASLAPAAHSLARYAALLGRTGKEAAAVEVLRIRSAFFPNPRELTSPPPADREQCAVARGAVAGGQF
jgi:tetratricopeptide (TPR) repeat protein